MQLSDYDLDECIIGGQWRCTVEEVQQAVTRLLSQKRAILERLRSRATSEDVTAERWAQSGDVRMESMHRKVADVLREELERLNKGI